MEYQPRRRKETITLATKRSLITTRPSSVRQFILGTIVLSLVVCLINPFVQQPSEAKKLKDKKVLKSLVKGLILKNLSTKKNFLPMPVPIPVPIELSEPPVYIKGKPKYVNVYKPTPVLKSAPIYQMPVYSPPRYEYMMNPMSLYGSMMITGNHPNYDGYNGLKGKLSSESSSPTINFTDFDDEFGSYYLRKKTTSNNKRKVSDYSRIYRAGDRIGTNAAWILPTDEEEAFYDEDRPHQRVKRQAYGPNYGQAYEREPPCHGFPLEINIKSRIKMDQIFPIYGNSQHKKCIKIPPRLH